jgi:hypothetical protein
MIGDFIRNNVPLICTICFFLGCATVYIPTEVNSTVCQNMMRDNTMIPKYYSFDVRMFNYTRHYENGSYFDYPYGKDWNDYIALLSREAGNHTGD